VPTLPFLLSPVSFTGDHPFQGSHRTSPVNLTAHFFAIFEHSRLCSPGNHTRLEVYTRLAASAVSAQGDATSKPVPGTLHVSVNPIETGVPDLHS
jgi:hypothetical protein